MVMCNYHGPCAAAIINGVFSALHQNCCKYEKCHTPCNMLYN